MKFKEPNQKLEIISRIYRNYYLFVKVNMSGGGKGEIEAKLEAFVQSSFNRFELDIEKDSISQENAQVLIKELMEKYGHGNAWDEQEFNRMFDLF